MLFNLCFSVLIYESPAIESGDEDVIFWWFMWLLVDNI